MTDESREAEIRKWATTSTASYTRTKNDVLVLLRIIDDLRTRLATAEQERDKWKERSDNAHEGQVAYEQLAHDRTKERDAALAKVNQKTGQLIAEIQFRQQAETERDAALAEAKALREALECIAHPVEKLDYGDPENLPAVMTLHALGALAALDAKKKP